MNTFNTTKIIALTFFVLGTVLFSLQLANPNITMVTVIGFYYLAAAVVINVFILLVLVIKICFEKQKIELLKSMAVILANAPIAFTYAYILFEYSFI